MSSTRQHGDDEARRYPPGGPHPGDQQYAPQPYDGRQYAQPYGDQPHAPQPYGAPQHGGPAGPAYPDGGYASPPPADVSYPDPSYTNGSYTEDGHGRPGGAGYAPTAQPHGTPSPAPDAWAGRSVAEPAPQGAADDQSATQTWQGQTWDTQYQPSLRPDPAVGPGTGAAAGQPGPRGAARTGGARTGGPGPEFPQGGYDRPDPHAPQGRHAQPEPYAQAEAYAQPEPYGQAEAYAQPEPYGQAEPYAQPDPYASHAPHASRAPHVPQPPQEHTTPLRVRGGSGSVPLPPEAPRTGAGVPPAGGTHGSAGAVPLAAPVPAPGAAGPEGYGPATTVGNARVTDAQRARAEDRSPIIAPGLQPAAVTAGLGLLLALGAAIGTYALVVPLVLLQAVTAAGWFRLNGMWPARQGIALAFAGGLVADVALLAAGRDDGPAAMLGTLGVWVLLTLVLQLRSHAGADERMYGLTATVVSAALAVLAAGHLAADPDAVVVGSVAVAVATVVRALPLRGPLSVLVALLASAAAGAAGGALTDFGTGGALLGAAAGGCALIGLRVASYDYPSRFVHMTAGVALPLTAAAPAVWLVGRMIG